MCRQRTKHSSLRCESVSPRVRSPQNALLFTTLLSAQLNVLWCQSHLVWLVFEDSISTCTCFHSENCFCGFVSMAWVTKNLRFLGFWSNWGYHLQTIEPSADWEVSQWSKQACYHISNKLSSCSPPTDKPYIHYWFHWQIGSELLQLVSFPDFPHYW